MKNFASNRDQGYRALPQKEFMLLFKSTPRSLCLDVRTPEEFSQGHLPGAINLDITQTDFELIINRIPKTTTLLLYCTHGKRALVFAKYLANLGYSAIFPERGIAYMAAPLVAG